MPLYVRGAVKALEKALVPGAVVPERDSAIEYQSTDAPCADSFAVWYASLTTTEQALYTEDCLVGMRAAFQAGMDQTLPPGRSKQRSCNPMADGTGNQPALALVVEQYKSLQTGDDIPQGWVAKREGDLK